MGTRSLIIVTYKGKKRLALACKWDGYPTGQGRKIAKFIQSKSKLIKLAKVIPYIKKASKETIKKALIDCGNPINGSLDYFTYEVSKKLAEKYPQLSNETGADILNIIIKNNICEVKNDIAFLRSPFCEWAYEIDLDKKAVKVYRGGRKIISVIKFKDFTYKKLRILEKKYQ